MKKNEQEKINSKCLRFICAVGLDFSAWHTDFVELSNKAEIARTNDYVILLSLGKLVAVYCISSRTLVDVLRHRVGYNGISARHIIKFCDIMSVIFGVDEMLCYQDTDQKFKGE